MKLTKTFAYALACIQELAKRQRDFVLVSEIAAAQGIPAPYCQKVLFALAKAGIVVSVRGQGFCLMEPPEMITISRVIHALGDEVNVTSFSPVEPLNDLSKGLNAMVHGSLSNLTVSEIIAAAKQVSLSR